MQTAKDIMTPNPVTVTPDTEITKAAELLLEQGFNGLPVVDEEGTLKGILCQSDLIALQKKVELPSIFAMLDGFIPMASLSSVEKAIAKVSASTVGQAMTPDPVSVQPEASLEEIASLVVDRAFHTLPVVQDGKLVGVIGTSDLVRTLLPTGAK